MSHHRILIVEDNSADVLLIREAMTAAGLVAETTVLKDGEAATQYLEEVQRGQVAPPDLVILDLNLPKLGGDEVLAEIRRNSVCGGTLVVIMSSANSVKERDAVRAADRYFCKPLYLEEYLGLGALLRQLLNDRQAG